MITEEQSFYLQALNSNFATIEFDPTGKIIGANQNFLDAMGYTLQEVQGKHHRIFCDPAYTQTDEYSQFWRDLGEGKSFTNEYARLNKNNDVVWIQATYNALKNEKGEVTKIIKIAQVITDRKLKVAEQEAKLDAINKSMGAIEFNMDGTVITANENFLNVIDYSLDEVKGIHHRKFVSDELANSEEYKNFWQDLNNGMFKTGVFERVAKDGHKVFIQATYNPV
ncbi:MAG: PAS domain-containing protein, partial [Bacteriovoracaceae bacterium]